MKSICFVCEGNICRSAIAEFLMKQLLKDAWLEDEFKVFSRGLTDYTHGEDTHPLSKEQLKLHNIPFETHHAQKISLEEYEKADLVIVMDNYNIQLLKEQFSLTGRKIKAKKLLSFCGSDRDIMDPYYTRNFDIAFNDIEKGCKALLKVLLKNQ